MEQTETGSVDPSVAALAAALRIFAARGRKIREERARNGSAPSVQFNELWADGADSSRIAEMEDTVHEGMKEHLLE